MKLIYLHQYFVFPEDSGGTRSFDLASAFLKRGVEVEIITSSAFLKSYTFTQRWTVVERNGLKLHVLNLDYKNEFSNLSRIKAFLKFLLFSTKKLLELDADVVLATSTPLTIGIPALVKKWLNKTPFIFEVRDVWPEAVIAIGAISNRFSQRILFYLEKLIYNHASAIVALSVDMKRSIVDRIRFRNVKPIEVIENISEIMRFQSQIDENKSLMQDWLGFKPRFTVVYAGTFGKVNGIKYVVDLASELVHLDPSVVFVIVGGGSEKDNIVRYANLKGVLDKNFFLKAAISKDELPQLYYEANMGSSFVIGIKELWANSANKFFDSLAAGKPVLINYGGWQKDVIETEGIGYTLPVELNRKAVQDFFEYTKRTDLHTVQKERCLEFARKHYSLEVAAGRYFELLKKVK